MCYIVNLSASPGPLDSFQRIAPKGLQEPIQGEPSDGPVAVEFPGAVLFADISSYTELAERLCDEGPEGVERLARILSAAFSRYVSCIHHAGGAIAGFAGDGILAYWAAENDGLWREQAQFCARTLHNNPKAEPFGDNPYPQLHAGLAAGPIWVTRLGGVDNDWKILFSGQAVREASRAAASAAPGETIVTSGFHSSTAQGRTVGPQNDKPSGGGVSKYQIGRGTLKDEVGTSVPRVVREWLVDGDATWLPQLRNICALFLRIEDVDESASGGIQRLQSVVATLSRAVTPYSGSRGSLVFDETGLVFKLYLGLPHDTHADDTLRAVQAGLALIRELEALGIDSSAGVASGRGLCTLRGGREHQEYLPVGRFMHMAARLMELGEGSVWCTPDIAQRLGDNLLQTDEHLVRLKGISDPTPVHRVLTAKHLDEAHERLSGRSLEKARIKAHLDGLDRGRGGILWVTGEPGVGKSALARYLIRKARARGFKCLVGQAESMENPVSYLAWRPVFEQLLRTDEENGNKPPSQEYVLERLSFLDEQGLVSLVNAVLPGLLEESQLVSRLSGPIRIKATLGILSKILRHLASESLVLVLEDCHWMDSASWRLLEQVSRELPDALIVLTSRIGRKPEELDELRRRPRFSDMHLEPLSCEAIEAIVGELLGSGDLPPEIISSVWDHSAGNPLVAREYTLLLVSLKHIQKIQGRWTLREPTQIDSSAILPDTVERMVASRLDTLSREQILTLETASVLGERFEEKLLREVHPDTLCQDELSQILSSLVEHELLTMTANLHGNYRFQHALIRDGAYNRLTPSQLQKLHLHAGRAVEQVYKEHLESHYATLAHHWWSAAVPTSTVHYSDLAATQAIASGAYVEARELLNRCLMLTEESGEVPADGRTFVRWYRQLADTHFALGHPAKRGSAARRALELARRPRPTTTSGLIARTVVSTGSYYLGRLRADRNMSSIGDSESLALDIAAAYRHSAAECFFANDSLGMIFDSLNAVELARTAPPSTILAGAYAELGGIVGVAGLRRFGEGILRLAVSVGEKSGDRGGLAYAHMVTCLYAVGVGNWRVAEESAHLCQEICEPLNDQVNWANAQAVRFWLNFYQAAANAAHAAAALICDRARETGNRQHQAWSHRFLALCLLRRDEPAEARYHLETALACLGDTAGLHERIPICGLLAKALLDTGHTVAARAEARKGLRLIVDVKRPINHANLESYAALTEVVVDAWKDNAASPTWRNAAIACIESMKRYRAVFPIGTPHYLFWKGRVRQLAGSPLLARLSFRRGAAAASRLGMTWMEERCREAWHQSFTGGGKPSSTCPKTSSTEFTPHKRS